MRAALARCDLQWTDMQFAYRWIGRAGNADTLVDAVGPDRRAVHQRRQWLRHRRLGSVRLLLGASSPANSISAWPWALTSTRAAHSIRVPADWGLPDWYGESGLMLTTQFFATKIRRYMALHGITSEYAWCAWPKRRFATARMPGMPGGARRWIWTRSSMRPMVSDPLTKFMFCSPPKAPSRWCWRARRKARELGLHAGAYRGGRRCARGRPDHSKCSRPALDIERGQSAYLDRQPRRLRDGGRRARGHRRRPDPGHRSRRRDHAHGRERLLCRRRAGAAWLAEGRTASRRRDADQHRRRLPGLRRADRRIRPAAGLRERACSCAARPAHVRCRARPDSATAMSTAHPACRPSRSWNAERWTCNSAPQQELFATRFAAFSNKN